MSNIISDNMKWIMLVSGAITCTMFYAFVAPEAALNTFFGESVSGPVANIVVRNWGALITLTGLMLIYGALHPTQRTFILTIAGISKIIFIGLVLGLGNQFLDKAGIAVVFDVVVVIIFAIYLVSVRRAA